MSPREWVDNLREVIKSLLRVYFNLLWIQPIGISMPSGCLRTNFVSGCVIRDDKPRQIVVGEMRAYRPSRVQQVPTESSDVPHKAKRRPTMMFAVHLWRSSQAGSSVQ